jgi:hypothetical protein
MNTASTWLVLGVLLCLGSGVRRRRTAAQESV